jgi:hypothetical protein
MASAINIHTKAIHGLSLKCSPGKQTKVLCMSYNSVEDALQQMSHIKWLLLGETTEPYLHPADRAPVRVVILVGLSLANWIKA